MNLFNKSIPKANPDKIKQIKTWVDRKFNLNQEIVISINQLQCHEPNCSPIETVIAIMSNPPKQYKIHKPISKIFQTDIDRL